MKWNTTALGKTPDDINTIQLSDLKSLVKIQLSTKIGDTTESKPTNFVAILEHNYPDGNTASMLLLGLWKGKFKNWATRDIAKQKGVVVGEVYLDGTNQQGTPILKFTNLKGRGKTQTEAIKKKLYPFVPKTKYDMQFVTKEIPAEKQKKVSPPKQMVLQTQALQELLKAYKRTQKEQQDNASATDKKAVQLALREWLLAYQNLKPNHQELLENWYSFFKKNWSLLKQPKEDTTDNENA